MNEDVAGARLDRLDLRGRRLLIDLDRGGFDRHTGAAMDDASWHRERQNAEKRT
jgi:hypothetical protein